MKQTGTIIEFNDERGFGFISPASGDGDLFFHISAVTGVRRDIAAGESVQFITGQDAMGRYQARRVWRKDHYSIETGTLVMGMVAAWFLIGITVLSVTGHIPFTVPGYYAGVSAISFAAYAWDKRRAGQGGRRIPEATLHFYDLCGGWPGGIVAQQMLRHKRRKASFMAVTATILVIHLTGWVWFVYRVFAA